MIEKTWNGISREEIDWFPTINESKCINCGICVKFCHNSTFGILNEKVQVISKESCVVGCTGCQIKCPTKAISHPSKKYLDSLLLSKTKFTLD